MNTLTDLLEQTAQKYPDKTYLALQDKSVTFKEISEKSRRLADAFSQRGITKGKCVAIVLRNSPEFVITYFALVRLGAIAVPINFLVQKSHELEYMLKDCGALGIVTQKEFLKNLKPVQKTLPSLKYIWCTDGPADGAEDFWTFLNSSPPTPFAAPSRSSGTIGASERRDELRVPAGAPEGPSVLAPHPSPLATSEDVTCILYTSGTTGSPKGVMLTHANLVSNCRSSLQALSISPKDVFLCILPMFHTFAWTACVLIPASLGCKVVVVPSVTPAKPWLNLMAKHGVTIFAAVPPIYSVLAKEAAGFKRFVLKYYFFRKVRFGVSGASPLSVE
ncbi:MAG: AMP-binding protein, partial [Elusimicrobia bacterium]|nr:AMP-binding protein [Elusimicrobiota bacterium]